MLSGYKTRGEEEKTQQWGIHYFGLLQKATYSFKWKGGIGLFRFTLDCKKIALCTDLETIICMLSNKVIMQFKRLFIEIYKGQFIQEQSKTI